MTVQTVLSAEKRPARQANDSAMAPDWTPARHLPNSSDELKWKRPKQVEMAEIHRDQPSYLRTASFRQPVPSGQAAAKSTVKKASFTGSPSKDPEPQELPRDWVAPAETLPLVAPKRAQPIPTIADDVQTPTVVTQSLITAEPTDEEVERVQAAEMPADDLLESLIPEEPASPSAHRTLPVQVSQLPSNEDGDRSDATPEGTGVVGDSSTDDGALRDAFGDELPDAPNDTSLPPAALDALPADLPGEVSEDTAVEDVPAAETNDDHGVSPAEVPVDEVPADSPTTVVPGVDSDGMIQPPKSSVAPTERRQPGDEVVDFNGRDCAKEQATLRSAWDEMRKTSIQEISLDITPSLEPTGSPEDHEKSRQNNMERAPARAWYNKNGELLARGKMIDFKNTLVHVEDESGSMKKLSWYVLGNEELCFVSAWWDLPSEATAENQRFAGRNWTPITMTWTASALCHKPLYFEEVQLERYGHSMPPARQAAMSGVHFFGSIFFLPYQMGLNPPNECQYALGYYRPGSCAPWLIPAVPLSARAARMQVGAIAGAITWLP